MPENDSRSPSKRKKRVVIVDDHPLVRERLAQLINHELDMEVCGEAEDSQSAMEIIRETTPDLAIIDVTLRGVSGIDLIKHLKALSIKVPILVLSMHEESIYAERALRAGASGYVTKHQSAQEIATAVRKILAGDIYLSDKMATGFLKSLTGGGIKSRSQPVDRLSDREFEVFALIGRGHSPHEIAKVLDVGLATVSTYRQRMKAKLDLNTATELQHFAITWVNENDRAS
jgi:DNA-binding NarL/FixJ family response regulator